MSRIASTAQVFARSCGWAQPDLTEADLSTLQERFHFRFAAADRAVPEPDGLAASESGANQSTGHGNQLPAVGGVVCSPRRDSAEKFGILRQKLRDHTVDLPKGKCPRGERVPEGTTDSC